MNSQYFNANFMKITFLTLYMKFSIQGDFYKCLQTEILNELNYREYQFSLHLIWFILRSFLIC